MVAVGGAFRKFIDGSVESVDLDIGYPVQICEKNPMGNSYATWQLGYPRCVSWNLLHRSIGSSAKNLCRLLKISCLWQLGPEK